MEKNFTRPCQHWVGTLHLLVRMLVEHHYACTKVNEYTFKNLYKTDKNGEKIKPRKFVLRGIVNKMGKVNSNYLHLFYKLQRIKMIFFNVI